VSSAEYVFLQDAFERVGRAVAIPGAVRVDDGDRSFATDAQAADLGPVDSARLALESEFAQASLEELPRLQGLLRRRAIAVDTQEDVAGITTDVEAARERGERLVGFVGFHGRRV